MIEIRIKRLIAKGDNMAGRCVRQLLALVVLYLCFVESVVAQKDVGEEAVPLVLKDDSTVYAEMDFKNIRFSPFVAPSVSPEVGLMLVGGGLISFKADRSDRLLQPSSVPFSFGYSSNGSSNFNFRPSIFFKNDKNRLSGDIWMKDMPDNYWGVGYDAAKNPSIPDSTTSYRRNWWQVYLKYVHRFKKDFFAGLLFDYNRTVATNMSNEMANDIYVQENGHYVRNYSLGLLLQYDTRDVTVNAYEGLFLEMSSNFYRSEGFDKPTYQIVVLDYRQYQKLGRAGKTLAWQAKSRLGLGNVPWPEMSQLGTPFDLRGYRWGRYRDKSMLFAVAEYRHMFMRKTADKHGNMMSRFGVVGWLATGSVGTNISKLQHWLPNAGIGLRFEIQKRMNARLDFGVGDDSSAIYISFNEAF
jgi:outer membrane protein assembly factor BamA